MAKSGSASCSRTSTCGSGRSISSPARRSISTFTTIPYLVISLGGGENEIETIFGDKIATNEPLGSTVFMNEMRPVHRLTNRDKVRYLSRLIELKSVRWTAE